MSFGERLRATRIDRGLSVNRLTELSDLGKSTICNLENNTQAMPGGQTVVQLCKVLNVSADYLLGLKPGRGDA